MRTLHALLVATAFAVVVSANAQLRYVTLSVTREDPTAILTVATNEAVRLVSGLGPWGRCTFKVEKDGRTFFASTLNDVDNTMKPLVQQVVVAGAATVTLSWSGNPTPGAGYLTAEIIPQSPPPARTLVLPEATAAADVIMESSSDLIHWESTQPGRFTNLTGQLFFRIRADRLP